MSEKLTFQIDDSWTFLNHGSYGACPIEIFEKYQAVQRELEKQPLLFFRTLGPRLKEGRVALERFLNGEEDSIVAYENVTTALNVVGRSLALTALKEDDEILTTSHEYGAIERMWNFCAVPKGVKYVRAKLTLPIESSKQIVEDIWKLVTPKTKILFLSHITSATALIFPVEELCKRAREKGIITVIGNLISNE